MSKLIETIKQKVVSGVRISDAEALALFESPDLLAIGELAAIGLRRRVFHPAALRLRRRREDHRDVDANAQCRRPILLHHGLPVARSRTYRRRCTGW